MSYNATYLGKTDLYQFSMKNHLIFIKSTTKTPSTLRIKE